MTSKSEEQGFERRRFRDRRLPKDLVPPLAAMKITVQPGAYVDVDFTRAENFAEFAGLCAGRFALFVSMPDGTGAIVPETLWNEVRERFPDAEAEKGLRVISLSVKSDWYKVGLLAIIGRVLTEAEVAAGVVSSASTVHLVMKGNRIKDCRVILDLLVSQAKGRLAFDAKKV